MEKYHDWLFQWFGKRAPNVHMGDKENFFMLGAIDSFGVIELIEDIEINYGIRFLQEDFLDRRFTSVSGLSEIIVEKLNATSLLKK